MNGSREHPFLDSDLDIKVERSDESINLDLTFKNDFYYKLKIFMLYIGKKEQTGKSMDG